MHIWSEWDKKKTNKQTIQTNLWPWIIAKTFCTVLYLFCAINNYLECFLPQFLNFQFHFLSFHTLNVICDSMLYGTFCSSLWVLSNFVEDRPLYRVGLGQMVQLSKSKIKMLRKKIQEIFMPLLKFLYIYNLYI